jgi:hypothetical protein
VNESMAFLGGEKILSLNIDSIRWDTVHGIIHLHRVL